MKKTFSIFIIIALICALSVTLIACDKDEEEVGIDRFEIEDYELTEGDKFDRDQIVITAYKTDETTVQVKNNLEYDLSEMEDVLDENDNLSEDSAGEYIVPVYHLEIHIGDLKVIVSVKK